MNLNLQLVAVTNRVFSRDFLSFGGREETESYGRLGRREADERQLQLHAQLHSTLGGGMGGVRERRLAINCNLYSCLGLCLFSIVQSS